MGGNPGQVRYGRDTDLEAEANKWLATSAGDNKRSAARDAEKMAYEAGLTPLEGLRFYDPRSDWGTNDSVFAIAINPHDVDGIEQTICAGVGDGNVRARNPRLWERQELMRHVEDTDSWGSTEEEGIPLLGVNEGPRKVCTRCKREKGLSLFSPRKGRGRGLQSWCKQCRREVESQKRNTRE